MGGGPSRDEREAQRRLSEQQTQAIATQNRLMERAEAPDPLAERVRASRMSWLDSVEGKNGPFDVSKVEGMAPYLDLWNRSRSRRDNARMGTGALRLGAANQNPEIAARIAEADQATREQDAAGGLQNAFNLKNAEMQESYMPLMQYQSGKDLSLAGQGNSNAANAANAYMQWLSRPQRRSFWSELALAGVGAGAQLGSAAITAGGV